MRQIKFSFRFDPVWWKVGSMLSVLFFIYLADAILSDWVPGYMQDSLGSAWMMGLVMAFSSVVGFVADLVFPQVMKGVGVRKMIILAAASSMIFVGTLFSATWVPWVLVFLLGMAVWGVYYEFLGFATQQFVAEGVEVEKRTSVWSIWGVFKSLAYFLGPMASGVLAVRGDRELLLVAGGLGLVGVVLLMVMKVGKRESREENERLNMAKELEHWWVLFEHVWPVVLMSLLLGLVDAIFWTTGTVWNDKLAETNWWGGMFLSAYMLPPLFIGLMMAKWGVHERKKKIAEGFMIASGVWLAMLGLSEAIWWQLLAVFLSSIMAAIAWPLVDAVYTDIVARMGRERKHLMGLSNSTVSLAYIVGPVLGGVLATAVGERMTFVVVGIGVAVITVVVMWFTPRKLKLPQQEIREWSI